MRKTSQLGRWLILSGMVTAFFFWLTTSTHAQAGVLEYRSDRILVKPKAGVTQTTLDNFHREEKCGVLRTFDRLGRLQVLSVPAGQTAASLIAKYQLSGLVEFAEPDYLGQVYNTTPDDPDYVNGMLWGLNIISAPQAWDVLTSASNIVVAVLDTGVRYTHQDLAANMWVNPVDGSHGWNAIDENNNPDDNSSPSIGHGTLVSGVLGAVGNNGVGVCGVAWQTQIMACQCFTNANGLGAISDCITCLDFAQTNGARIINASWGFPTNSLALSNAIVSLQPSNIILVAACGNNTNDLDANPNYPSGYHLPNVISVAATRTNDTLSAYSNYGANTVQLGAPGDGIWSTWSPNDSYYYSESGTSFAAPYVSGACALLMAQYPADTYQQTITRVLSSTDPLPSLAGKCSTGGRLNLQKALRTILINSLPTTNGGPLELCVSGGLNRNCVVWASTNLANWSSVFTNTSAPNGTFNFVDYSVTNSPARFYRASANP